MAPSRVVLTPEEIEAMYEVALILIEFSQQFVEEEDEEYEEEDEEEEEAAHQKQHKKRKTMERDDSEETLGLLYHWKASEPDNPPGKFFVHVPNALVEYSKPLRKQLTESDVKDNQSRFMLGKMQVKEMMHDLFGPNYRALANFRQVETNGLEVLVYGPDGEVNKMMFKMWNTTTPVLMSVGWKEFVKKYKLKMHCDILTVWMFKHKKTRQICFAIDKTTFPIEKKLSPRILKKLDF